MIELILWPFFIHTLSGFAYFFYLFFAMAVAPFVLLTVGLATRPRKGNITKTNPLVSPVFLISGAFLLLWEFLFMLGIEFLSDELVIVLLLAGPAFVAMGMARTKLALPKAAVIVSVLCGLALTYFFTLPVAVWWLLEYV